MIDLQVTLDKLSHFETADEIAQYLIDQGVKGVPCDSGACAIAAFISMTTDQQVFVDPSYITRDKWMETEEFRNTPAMTYFINKFDDLEYPELVLMDCNGNIPHSPLFF